MRLSRFTRADVPGGFIPIHHRHLTVNEELVDLFGTRFIQQIKRVCAMIGDHGFYADVFKDTFQYELVDIVIFDYECFDTFESLLLVFLQRSHGAS